MTTSFPIPGPSRSRKAGTTSAAGQRRAARTPTSPRTTGGRCASSPGSPQAQRHAAQSAGGTVEGRLPGRGDHGRLRPRRRLPAGLRALPRPAGALVTYRRAPLAVPAALPVITAVTYAFCSARRRAGETVQLKDCGQARQITLFEHAGRPAVLPLTSVPARGHPVLLSPGAGGELLCTPARTTHRQDLRLPASIETNTKLIRNPARYQANAAVRDAEKSLASAERCLAALLADPGLAPAAKAGVTPSPWDAPMSAGSHRGVIPLTGPDAQDAVHRAHPDLPVADRAGTGVLGEQLD